MAVDVAVDFMFIFQLNSTVSFYDWGKLDKVVQKYFTVTTFHIFKKLRFYFTYCKKKVTAERLFVFMGII